MRRDRWRRCTVLVLAVAFAAPLAAQKHVPSADGWIGTAVPRAVDPRSSSVQRSWPDASVATSVEVLRPGGLALDGGTHLPRWARWGMVGAAAGAIVLPLLGSLASDSQHHPARDALAGAAAGFVVIGGGVALWDAVCSGPTRSRRAGLCGGR